ncbi:DUF2235 domain-containing protein [Pseudoduganella sp.]|uniref:T6SS phospholipase effector Tle1-like catalytic domain-containing protein n=1 Tax=Pseudoduganella sp. TaxID=1880898 RepID=UPI0035B0B31F
MSAKFQSAKNPELFQSRSNSRPLNARELMLRAKALCAKRVGKSALSCSGQIFAGFFFDGTGNNMQRDFKSVEQYPSKHQHSNVVRLFHAFPDAQDTGTDKYYAAYIPGVGTPFKEIDDDGGKMGTAMSWNGEPRIFWAMLELLNFVSDYVSRDELISNERQRNIANNLGGIGSTAFMRNNAFRIWTARLSERIKKRRASIPELECISVSVFGFSRGAAESRAFVNWLFEICEEKGGTHYLAGIPLIINFLGIFDTVASVGIANAYTSGILKADGHQSWADNNMQVHKHVQSCLHIVAAHEVRSTFPLDSVRVEGIYPPNVREYVYPGAHSDVGGGYSRRAQGKTDALARIAGFEMYCAALAAGVPFYMLHEMKQGAREALVPTQAAVNAFQTYMSHARVKEAPVEDMMRQHMAHYFTYRYQARKIKGSNPNASYYYSRNFFKAASAEREYLRDTQQHFIAILARAVKMMDKVMQGTSWCDHPLPQPYRSTLLASHPDPQFPADLIIHKVAVRGSALYDDAEDGSADQVAQQMGAKVDAWFKWLADNNYAYLVDEDAPERDIVSVLQSLSEEPQAMELVEFFDQWVHDSMAGLAKDGLNEFLANGTGMAKFRKVYFGNEEDSIIRNSVAEENARKLRVARAKRAQKKQWDLDAIEYARTR